MNSNFLTCCLVSVLLCQVASAELTYNLVDPGVPGHTLTGTITITGEALQSGLLGGNDVTGWQVTVTGDEVNFSISNLTAKAALFLQGGGFVVTSQTISLDLVNSDPGFEFIVFTPPNE